MRKARLLGALLLLWALALQSALPVVHASAHAVSAATSDAHTVPSELYAAAATHASPGDPASCPVCQSLHGKPAVMPPAPSAHAFSATQVAFTATAQRIHAAATHRAHAPRAPPLEALSLA
jgi:hypothetical protein